jgi:hypothetical protein
MPEGHRLLLQLAVYDDLGEMHRDLLDEIRRMHPASEGEELGLLALRLLSRDAADRIAPRGASDLRRWVERQGGELPRVKLRESLNPFGEDPMRMDLRWIGLAVVVAVLGGALLYLRRRQASASADRDSQSPEPPRVSPTSVSSKRSLRIAVAIPGSNLREVGLREAAAADILTRATYWWTGEPGTWDRVVADLGLSDLTNDPGDDEMVLIAFDIGNHTGSAPSSRPEAATLLRDAAVRGDVSLYRSFSLGAPQALSGAKFRR